MSMWIAFAVLIFLCLVTTFFAFRSNAILFRMSAAISWLSFLLLMFDGDYIFSLDRPWVISLMLGVICMIFAILVMYIGREIDQYGRLVKKHNDGKTEEQRRQDDYKKTLMSITKKSSRRRRR